MHFREKNKKKWGHYAVVRETGVMPMTVSGLAPLGCLVKKEIRVFLSIMWFPIFTSRTLLVVLSLQESCFKIFCLLNST